MKRLANRYGGIAIVIFAAQLVGAFIIGALIETRWSPESGVPRDEVPVAWVGGATGVLVVCLYLLLGWLLRFIAYTRLERRRGVNRRGWWTIVAIEGTYAIFNLAVLWAAVEPLKDGNLRLVYLIMGAILTTIASIVFLALVVFMTRTQTLHGLREQ